jgi:hypothetical protein
MWLNSQKVLHHLLRAIERDQVEDYARRKGWTVAEAEKWLAPILNYDPARPIAEAAA